jgi:glycosyltransferase involved in cell wall biosynthesis
MKIWLINPYGPILNEGWRDYRFAMIGETLAQHGHQVTWWTANFSHHFKCFRSKGWKDIEISPNVQIRLVPTSGYRKHIGLGRVRFEILFAWRMYHRAVKESPPECIIAVEPPQTIGFLAVRLARQFKARLILDVMDLWPEIFTLAFPRLLRPLAPMVLYPLYVLRRHNLRLADAITSLCDTYLEAAKRQAPQCQITVTIFNGIDVAGFRAMNREPDKPPAGLMQRIGQKTSEEVWVVYAGTLGHNYDVKTLLQAAAYLQQGKSKIKIFIAGEGPLRNYVMDFIATYRSTNLLYLGKLNPRELTQLYQVCDIGLCAYGPESNVAMPDKAYDYMAAGLPIVNSLRGELENLLYEYQIGIQYVAGNPNSLADAIEWMAANEEQRRIMARNSYNAAMQFDRHVQYRKFVALVEKLLQNDSQACA